MERYVGARLERRGISGRAVAFCPDDRIAQCGGNRSACGSVYVAWSCRASSGWSTSAIATVVAVAIFLPAREMYAPHAIKGDDASSSRSRSPRRGRWRGPAMALAVEDFARKLGEAGFKDWAIEAVGRGARARARTRRLAGARCSRRRVAYVDRLDVVPGARLREPRARRVRVGPREGRRRRVPELGRGAHAPLPAAPRRGREVGHRSHARSRRASARPASRRFGRSASTAATTPTRAQRRRQARTAPSHAPSGARHGRYGSQRQLRASRGVVARRPRARHRIMRRSLAARGRRADGCMWDGHQGERAARAHDGAGHRRCVEPGDRPDRGRRGARSAPGSSSTRDGLIATNLHVIEGESNIQVKLYKDPTEYPVTVDRRRRSRATTSRCCGSSRRSRCRRCGSATRARCRPAIAIYAIGNPLGVFDYSVTDGLISQVRPLVGRPDDPPDLGADLAGLERRPAVQPVRRGDRRDDRDHHAGPERSTSRCRRTTCGR